MTAAQLCSMVILTITLTSCGSAYIPSQIISSDQKCTDVWADFRDRKYINPKSYNPSFTVYSSELMNMRHYISHKRYSSSLSTVSYNKDCVELPIGVPSYYIIATTMKDERAKNARNLLMQAIMGVSDTEVEKHLASLRATKSNLGLLFSAATAGLTGWGTVASESTARAVTAAATGTTSFNAAIGDNIYRDVLLDTVINTIGRDREQYKSFLESNYNKLVTEYTVEQAIEDAIIYHKKGAFNNGLNIIKETAENANKEKNIEANRSQEQQRTNAALQRELLNIDLETVVLTEKLKLIGIRERFNKANKGH